MPGKYKTQLLPDRNCFGWVFMFFTFKFYEVRYGGGNVFKVSFSS